MPVETRLRAQGRLLPAGSQQGLQPLPLLSVTSVPPVTGPRDSAPDLALPAGGASPPKWFLVCSPPAPGARRGMLPRSRCPRCRAPSAGATGIHTGHPVPHRRHSCMPASKSSTDGTSESTARVSLVQRLGQCGSDWECPCSPLPVVRPRAVKTGSSRDHRTPSSGHVVAFCFCPIAPRPRPT